MSCVKNEKYAEIGRKMRAIPLEKHNPSHEWEELVEKLRSSDDAGLQCIGNKEHDLLKQYDFERSKKQE